MKNRYEGIMNGAAAYLLWGFLPIYWKALDHVSPGEVLAHRIFWSFWFMLALIIIGKKTSSFKESFRQMGKSPRARFALIAVSILISINWLIFIWSVHAGKIVETSLGYYINPLISIVLGVFVLKEKLVRTHIVAFFLALAGVLFLTVSYGQFPWISFALALTFGLYGLIKKVLPFDSSIGLTLETMVVTPIALIYIILMTIKGTHVSFSGDLKTDIFMIASGAATALPLLLFAKGVRKVPLYLMGFLQYIAPTIMLFLGVFLYHEPFGTARLIAFAFIWAALLIVSLSTVKWSGMHSKQRNKIA
ncbi:EamA family transporter RarD [Siminovitchia fortis]|uniref:EamA family transporter RarD n=1 Tax=Siminovitchia fortis TaxID=254758 RepID=A0A443IPJ0_9BACI|nr:EamA family transporter RarD [Siminovitchia fortis]RWR07756.1 EamA family transporter RarD [Siminovitchia fortis]WHY82310.1 EamA family transporter RarD [Siminovitchia fortis]